MPHHTNSLALAVDALDRVFFHKSTLRGFVRVANEMNGDEVKKMVNA